MSVRPESSTTFSAFLAFCARPTLPATATIASTSSSLGEARASRMATASSCPGSVSMMILRFIQGFHPSCDVPRPATGAPSVEFPYLVVGAGEVAAIGVPRVVGGRRLERDARVEKLAITRVNLLGRRQVDGDAGLVGAGA